MGAVGGLAHLWTEWGIQILVLGSFALQVLLLVVGWMRRRGLPAWQRIGLWFAYLLADSTAIYALGHLSITSSSPDHRLVAFWAPFLLLHLGGPHNITAYSLEDNRLWLRHLQTLVVQVLGAAYVVYKYMADSGSLLLLASVCMFVAGTAKYGERTWALKCANMSSSDGESDVRVRCREFLRQDMGDDQVLLRAHSQFAICKSCFNDSKVIMDGTNTPTGQPHLSPFYGEDIFKLLEMELSLMYDTLYTKAAVMHTWYGFCFHSISLVGTSAAFCLFQLSLVVGSRSSYRYSRSDVVVSYVLLAGALALEAISACKAIFSSWTCYFILRKAEDSSLAVAACLQWLHRYAISPLRKLLKPASMRRWHDTIGQYNLIHLATRDKTGLGSKLAAKIGQEDRWNKLHFSGTFSGSDSLSMPRLKELLFKLIRREGLATRTAPFNTLNTRGRFILDRKQVLKGVAGWAVQNIEFDESIVIWHIATDLFLWESKAAGHEHEAELVEATRVLSNYMMFLLVAKPNMLPSRERRIHLRPTSILQGIWQRSSLHDEDKSPTSCWNKYWCCRVLEELMHHEGPDCTTTITQAQGKMFADILSGNWSHEQAQEYDSVPGILNGSIDELYSCATPLAKQLLHLGRSDTLEIVFLVWVEIMLYAADNCPRDSHARELTNGGEFITVVWLLIQHWMYVHRYKIAA